MASLSRRLVVDLNVLKSARVHVQVAIVLYIREVEIIGIVFCLVVQRFAPVWSSHPTQRVLGSTVGISSVIYGLALSVLRAASIPSIGY